MLEKKHALLIGLVLIAVVVILSLSGVFTVNILQMNNNQMVLGLIIFVVVMVAGLVMKLILDFTQSDGLITWPEYLVGGLIVGVLFAAVGVNIGWKLAFDNTVTFNQNMNVWEAKAIPSSDNCSEDGPCINDYNCDPYIVEVPYSCGTDNKDTCYRPETRYHSCPYVKTETTYVVTDTAGNNFVMGDHCMPDNPDSDRWDPSVPVQVGNACVGVPPLWSAANARIQSGHPGPVTIRSTYTNYILASDTTTLKQYSDKIDTLTKAGLMPDLPRSIRDFYYEDRVVFVGGFKPENPEQWQAVMAYFDSAFGNELHGDAYLVIGSGNLPMDPETYTNAVRAHWLDVATYGKDALAKNGTVVVMWTENGVVTWARAFTGMPIGNNGLITAFMNHAAGTPATPFGVIGLVDSQFYMKTKSDGSQKLDVKTTGNDGFMRQTFWGLTNPDSKFCRISMTGNSDCGSGFSYLKDNIKPSFGQQLTIVIVIFILGMILWVAEAFYVGDLRNY